MENGFKKIPSDYCGVDSIIVTVRNGFVKFLKYQSITDWSSAIGMKVPISFKWFKNKETASSSKHL